MFIDFTSAPYLTESVAINFWSSSGDSISGSKPTAARRSRKSDYLQHAGDVGVDLANDGLGGAMRREQGNPSLKLVIGGAFRLGNGRHVEEWRYAWGR